MGIVTNNNTESDIHPEGYLIQTMVYGTYTFGESISSGKNESSIFQVCSRPRPHPYR